MKVKIRKEILNAAIPVAIDRINLLQSDPQGELKKEEED